MPTTKIAQTLWLADRVREAPNTRLWLTTSGEIISGRPVTSSEYYQLVIGMPGTTSAPVLEQDLLAFREAEVTHGASHHTFNTILVDLNLIVAWGAFIETASTSSPGEGLTK